MNHPIYEKAKRGEWIGHADRAKLIRSALKAAFPQTKFSVTSQTYSGGGTVRIHWMDGPQSKAVDKITGQFETKGFDGSIDLAHSRDLWLAPDGSASVAHDSGTQGSGGYHPEVIGSAHHPDAILVSNICSGFVSCSRSISPALYRAAIEKVRAMNWRELEKFPWGEVEIRTYENGAGYLHGPAHSHQMQSGRYLDSYIHSHADELTAEGGGQ